MVGLFMTCVSERRHPEVEEASAKVKGWGRCALSLIHELLGHVSPRGMIRLCLFYANIWQSWLLNPRSSSRLRLVNMAILLDAQVSGHPCGIYIHLPTSGVSYNGTSPNSLA